MYPLAFMKDYLTMHGDEGWQDILDRYGIDVVVWKTDGRLAQLLKLDKGWKQIHRDDLATVWVRA
jgi:hypothetical protein